MSTNLENSSVATGVEKVCFHSNPKERQWQRMFKLLYNALILLFKVKKWKSLSRVWLFNPGKDPRILQARILEWVAYPFSSRSFWPRNQTQVSCIAGRFFTNWATREAPMLVKVMLKLQARLQQCVNQDLQIYKLSLEKAEGWWDDLRE